MKALRPYQADALGRVRERITLGSRRIILCIPTGAGKTLIAAHIVSGALAKGNRAVFTAPMITLIDQTIAAFEAEGIVGIGAMQANHHRTNPSAPVQVASVQTLQRRGEVPGASVVLVDEAHVYSKAIVDWMQERPDLIFIGLTATPGRRGMADEWGDIVVGVTTRELIEQGYLSRYEVFAPSTADLGRVRITAGEYNAGDAERAMTEGSLVGDILQNYLLAGQDRPTLGFAVSVAHAKFMADQFTMAGVPSAYVEAATDTLERAGIRRQFERGDIRVIWSVRTMTTGVDLPVSGIIDAAPTRSAMLHQQKIGRGLRVNKGTEDLVVWDHAGNTLRLGFVEDLDWSSLPDGSRKEAGERTAPLPKPCQSCAGIMPAKVKVCPACGHERKPPTGFIETEEGELVPIRNEATVRKKHDYSEAFKREWHQGFVWIAQERGHSPGWIAHKYKERFGDWPPFGSAPPPREPSSLIRSWVKSRQIAYAKAKQKQGGGAHVG